MPTPEVKIYLIEDDPNYKEVVATQLDEIGLGVNAIASTLEEAKDLIDRVCPPFAEGTENAPDARARRIIFIVDGNLTPGTRNRREGQEIVRQINEQCPPNTLTIGFSGSGRIPGATCQVPKDRVDTLGRTVNRLLEG